MRRRRLTSLRAVRRGAHASFTLSRLISDVPGDIVLCVLLLLQQSMLAPSFRRHLRRHEPGNSRQRRRSFTGLLERHQSTVSTVISYISRPEINSGKGDVYPRCLSAFGV